MRVVGIMSGTSLDGIDVAVVDLGGVDLGGSGVATVAFGTVPYPDDTRNRILAVSDATCSTGLISRLNFELGELYAAAVRQVCADGAVQLESIHLIGCHGQTVYHEGSGTSPNTLQIGEADVIAERIGVPVVSGFRTRDIAAGGLGAPLVPLADYLLFGDARIGRVALNIGGIANITVLRAGAPPEELVAFDTGPGNMVVDQLVERMSGGVLRYDRHGEVAATGQVDAELLSGLLRHPYYRQPPPKTAGREQYGREFVDSLVGTGIGWPDLIATATELTAATVAESILRTAPWVEEVAVGGGGVHNGWLMGRIRALLPGVRVASTAEFGVDPDAREAIAFAVLAHRTWNRQTGNLPSATGALHAVVLGKVSFCENRF